MSFVDKMLVCRDCGTEFVFSAGEQEFYQLKGLLNEPGRCSGCRAARKAEREGGGMGSPESRGRREMHATVCAECGAPIAPKRLAVIKISADDRSFQIKTLLHGSEGTVPVPLDVSAG